MDKYNSKNMLQDVLKHAVYSILFIILTLFISIFYIIMAKKLSHYLTTDGEVIFITIVIIVELVLGILFIYLFKKTNKYKKLFFIISIIVFDNLFILMLLILPDTIFDNLSFAGVVYFVFYMFTGIYLILLLSNLMYMYVFNKSAYFSKQLSSEKNVYYTVLYLFFCFIIYSVIICFIILYIYYLKLV